MSTGRRVQLGLAVASLLGMLPLLALTQAPATTTAVAALPALSALPVAQWTPRILALEGARDWARLGDELGVVRAVRPDLDAANGLGYLQARARLEAGDRQAARRLLQPFLAPAHLLRDLALYHLSRVELLDNRPAEAALLREDLVFNHPQARYRTRMVEEQADYLETQGVAPLEAFALRLGESAGAPTRRLLQARLVEALLREGQKGPARDRGLALLREGTADDAADRVSRALDEAKLVEAAPPESWVLVAEAARTHRRFDRAIPLLQKALPHLPARRSDLLFSLGRAYFFAERFPEAEKAYLAGAASARDAETRGSFLYQAARAAQLGGDDARAERHLAAAIGAPHPAPRVRPRRGRGRKARARPAAPAATSEAQPRVAAALVQRLRIRAAQKRMAEAERDLRLLEKLFPRSEAQAEGTMAYAVALVAGGRFADAQALLVPLTAWRKDDSLLGYWLGRSQETIHPAAALEAYRAVLRGQSPTHLAVFARERLQGPLREASLREAERLGAEAQAALGAGDLERARALQSDAYLLAPAAAREAARARLEEIYRRLPEYKAALELRARAFPGLPVVDPAPAAPAGAPLVAGTPEAPPPAPPTPSRVDLLMALGLFDDAADLLPQRYPLGDAQSALTRAEALQRGGVPPGAIRAAEGALRALPAAMVPDLLPRRLQELLYPRYFWERVQADAQRQQADPRLVLSVMREESRFEARAKSAAAARGLLQLIIGTARAVGAKLGLMDVKPDVLYQPEVAIPLGARYLGDLVHDFGGDRYRAVAAYNAGPAQSQLWARMAPGPGADTFYASVNFDETRRYVGRVLSTYERYGEIYGR
jgi:soluble lytic murein transglycosylase-like protein